GDLVLVIAAGNAVGRLADLLHGRQQQADENGDDGNHDQQLDQREGPAFVGTHAWSPWTPPSAVSGSLAFVLTDGRGSQAVAEAIGQETTVEIREHLVQHPARPALDRSPEKRRPGWTRRVRAQRAETGSGDGESWPGQEGRPDLLGARPCCR